MWCRIHLSNKTSISYLNKNAMIGEVAIAVKDIVNFNYFRSEYTILKLSIQMLCIVRNCFSVDPW